MNLPPINREGLLTLAAYNAYANRLVLDTADRISEEILRTSPSPSHDNPWKLLKHMLRGEGFFLALCQETTPGDLQEESLAGLRAWWEDVAGETQAFIAGLQSGEELRTLEMKLGGKSHPMPIWQLFSQAFLHSTHHRGELSILLSGLGQPLPTLDIILFYVEQGSQSWMPRPAS